MNGEKERFNVITDPVVIGITSHEPYDLIWAGGNTADDILKYNVPGRIVSLVEQESLYEGKYFNVTYSTYDYR